jgi:hypothetical protein
MKFGIIASLLALIAFTGCTKQEESAPAPATAQVVDSAPAPVIPSVTAGK